MSYKTAYWIGVSGVVCIVFLLGFAVGGAYGDTTADALANYETEMEKENVGTK